MSCASCVATVKKAIESMPGVSQVEVNLVNNLATFYYDPNVTTILDIAKNVKKAGYSLKLNLEEDNKELKDSKKRLIYSIIFLIPITILMIINMFNIFMTPYIMDILEMFLSIPLILGIGFNIHKRAFYSLFHKIINMDLLISIGTLASLFTGFLKIFGLPISNFSFVGAMITLFFLLGKYLENLAKGKASKEIRSLLELGAKKARIIVDGEEVEVKINELEVGDLMVIKPFEKIPTDGIIIEGSTTVDESMVTGESNEVVKNVGDEVIGGTMNGGGRIVVRITKNQDETFLANLIKLVEEAQNSKVNISKNILIFAEHFLPWINPNLNRISLSLFSMIATLVIACPCALGLATPTAIMVSSGISAKRGIFIRNGEAIQRMKDVTIIVFDKTGTLTYGKPKVIDVIDLSETKEGYKILASLEKYSSHILGKSIVEWFVRENSTFYDVLDYEGIPGVGVKGKINGKEYFVGNIKEILKIVKDIDEKVLEIAKKTSK